MNTNKAKVINVLLIGQNYASIINSLSIGFDQTEGIKARAISLDRFTSHYNNYGNYFYKTVSSVKGRIPYFFSKLIGFIVFLYLLIWCDLVHVYFLPSDTESKKTEHFLINFFCKRKVVTFMGSEVRVPQIASMKNPYFSEAYSNPLYEYKTETLENSQRIQRLYASDNYKLVIWDVESYIDSGLFKDIQIVPHASINSIKSTEASLDGSILVVHSPSAPVAKGTAIIKAAMEDVISNFPNVTFKILEGISNSEYQRYLAQSDILVDQMVWGAYGVAAQQAMEMGKIVCAYVNEDRQLLYGKNCPIIIVTKETFFNQLKKLITDVEFMKKTKQASLLYYAETHHPVVVANKMKQAYLSFFYGD